MSAPTAADVARWMLNEVETTGALYQDIAAAEIFSRFGEAFTFTNENGNLGIAKPVLAEFRKLTGDSVVWERGERYWRKREDHDEPGRRQG